MPTPSPEQAAYRRELLETTGSILLEAVAGSGKTTTIMDNLDAIKGEKAVLAFNRKIADELQARVKKLAPMQQLLVNANTAHSFGLSTIKRAGIKPRTDSGKVNYLIKDALEHFDWQEPIAKSKHLIRQLVSSAKAGAFDCTSVSAGVHFPRSEDYGSWYGIVEHFNLETEIAQIWGEDRLEKGVREIIRYAQMILKQSNNQRLIIDFDDMLYLPLLWDLEYRKYDAVLIDEAQDTNVVRAEQAFRMLKPDGRLVIVGDPHQAIYGFTGADVHALANLQARSAAKKLPLSVCWRCDDEIIKYAQSWGVPHITSHNAGTGKGKVRSLPFEQLMKELQPGDAVLCRLNRPNVALAIALLQAGKTPRIEGRDLGKTLMKHARMANADPKDLSELVIDLEDYKQRQCNLLAQKEKHKAADYLADEVDALVMLVERCLEQGNKKLFDLERLCNELFVDDASKGKCIVLSSIHKAKGLEWPRVYGLGVDDYMPFHRATAEWELVQEYNLGYVMATRAEHEFVIVTGVQSALDKGLHRSVDRVTIEVDSEDDVRDQLALEQAADRAAYEQGVEQ